MENPQGLQPPESWIKAHYKELHDERIENAPNLVNVEAGVVTVENDDESMRGEQSFGYCVVKPKELEESPAKNNVPVIIRFGQWSEDSHRQYDIDRSIATAALTGLRVISIDTPGQSNNVRPRLTNRQKEAMASGDFNPVTSAQWGAVEEVLANEVLTVDAVEFILAGSSQGATLVASALQTAPEEAEISTAILWNTPSFTTPKERSPWLLGKQFLGSGEGDKEYKEFNPDWVSEDNLSRLLFKFGGRPINHLRAVKGMAEARDHERLPQALNQPDGQHRRLAPVLFRLIHGTDDDISAVWHNKRAEEMLKAAGFSSVDRRELNGEYHAITNCMGAVAVATNLAIANR